MTKTLKSKKVILCLSLVLVTVIAIFGNKYVIATARPAVRVGYISNCSEGDSISFFFFFSGSNLVNGGNRPFNSSYVTLHGFSANVNVIKNSYTRYTVTLNNIRGNSSGNYVEIRSGAAIANDGLGAAYSATTNSNSFSINAGDSISPSISLIGPNISSVNNGGTVTYIVRYTDASGVTNVNLYANSVKLNGFTAKVSVSGSGENSKVVERKITLSNIQGTNGSKYITVVAATASDYAGNRTRGVNSSPFSLVNRTSNYSNKNSSGSGNNNSSDNNEDNKEENKDDEEKNENRPADWIPNPKTGKY